MWTSVKKHISSIGLIFFIVSFGYGNSLFNGFVWDDYLNIVNNQFIQSFDNLSSLFSRDYLTSPAEIIHLEEKNVGAGEMSYRPVVTLTYFIDYFFWKLNAFGYHVTNFVLHFFNTLLVYSLVLRISHKMRYALLTSLIFAIHPVQTEAVLTISFREDLLACFFVLSGFLFYLSAEKDGRLQNKNIVLSSLCYALGLFSKEVAITLPVLIILYEYYFVLEKGFSKLWRHIIRRYYGFGIVIIFYFWVWGVLMRRVAGGTITYPGDSFYVNVLTMIKIFARYILWFIAPTSIHPTFRDISLYTYSFWHVDVIAATIVVGGCFVLSYVFRQKNKMLSFGILWFFVSMLPMSNVIPIQNILAARYLYLPSVGFCLILALGIEDLLSNKGMWGIKISREATITGFCGILLFYGFLTLEKSFDWRNEISFRKAFVRYYPHYTTVYRVLAGAYKRKGLYDEAILYTKKAKDTNPRAWDNYLDMADLYIKKGRDDLAIKEIDQVLEMYPNHYLAHNQKCILLVKQRSELTINCYESLLQKEPKYMPAYYNLGLFYFSLKRVDEAKEVWERGQRINPDDEWLKRAAALAP